MSCPLTPEIRRGEMALVMMYGCWLTAGERRVKLFLGAEIIMSTLGLTTTEAAALLNIPTRKVWGEIDRVLEDLPSPPRLSMDAVVYLMALTELDALDPSVEGRKRFYVRIRAALAANEPPVDELPLVENGDSFRFKLRAAVEAIGERLAAFDRWKADRVVIDSSILAGEPVFKGSRLSVRHIGLLGGRESIATILEDYPYLVSDDVLFAAWYSKAYPRVGRPRESA
jgi:uncharacterized protein (DUF433 family)